MQHRILGDNDCPILEISLNPGERVKIERGSMAYMAGVELQGKMNSGANGGGLGGLLSAVGRSLASGESMFITEAIGVANGGRIGVAPSIPGKIVRWRNRWTFRHGKSGTGRSVCQCLWRPFGAGGTSGQPLNH